MGWLDGQLPPADPPPPESPHVLDDEQTPSPQQ